MQASKAELLVWYLHWERIAWFTTHGTTFSGGVQFSKFSILEVKSELQGFSGFVDLEFQIEGTRNPDQGQIWNWIKRHGIESELIIPDSGSDSRPEISDSDSNCSQNWNHSGIEHHYCTLGKQWLQIRVVCKWSFAPPTFSDLILF